jgi:Coenzyme PQQ synthesis protein D (PqqD)
MQTTQELDRPMATPTTGDLLAARLRLPQHVVHRSFVAETVMLNLNTGQYHGLNRTAGRMLEALQAAPTMGAVVPELAREYGVEPAQIETDLVTLCQELLERGLIEIADAEPRA